jgi:hypothetical protein
VVFPRAIAHAYEGFLAVVRDELESPLHPRTIEELKRHFEQVRATPNASLRLTDERLMRAAEAFERPRFYTLYRRWLKEGDQVLETVSSTVHRGGSRHHPDADIRCRGAPALLRRPRIRAHLDRTAAWSVLWRRHTAP